MGKPVEPAATRQPHVVPGARKNNDVSSRDHASLFRPSNGFQPPDFYHITAGEATPPVWVTTRVRCPGEKRGQAPWRQRFPLCGIGLRHGASPHFPRRGGYGFQVGRKIAIDDKHVALTDVVEPDTPQEETQSVAHGAVVDAVASLVGGEPGRFAQHLVWGIFAGPQSCSARAANHPSQCVAG